jgi:hypothetical protein
VNGDDWPATRESYELPAIYERMVRNTATDTGVHELDLARACERELRRLIAEADR